MAAPLLLRGIPFIRLGLQRHRLAAGLLTPARLPLCTAAEPSRTDDGAPSASQTNEVLSIKEPPHYPKWDDPDYQKWKDREAEILQDIEPITALAKEILHSERYLDGECLTDEDERAVVEKLLAYHPNSEDKIGCGLDCIMIL